MMRFYMMFSKLERWLERKGSEEAVSGELPGTAKVEVQKFMALIN